MRFLAVYVREAHPIDGLLPERLNRAWLMDSPERRLLVEDPQSLGERVRLARECARALELGFPVAVDGLDDAVNAAYAAWPDRLYLIGRGGRVAYRGGKGPMGFLPDELEAAIEVELAASAR